MNLDDKEENAKKPSGGGWGPARQTFTMDNPGTFRTFNSITDNPVIGDERMFVRIREAGVGKYGSEIAVHPGKEYEIYTFYHNNAAASLNDNGTGIAQNVRIKAQYPSIVKDDEIGRISSIIYASNAQPVDVWGVSTITTDREVALSYIPDSATIYNRGKANGTILSPNLFSKNGVLLGHNKLDGLVPGGGEYSGYILYRLRVDEVSAAKVTKQEKTYLDLVLDEVAAMKREALSNPGYEPALADSYDKLGEYYEENYRYEEAEEAYRASLEIRKKCANSVPGTLDEFVSNSIKRLDLEFMSKSFQQLGLLYIKTQRVSESEEAYKAALEIRKKLAGDKPSYEPLLAETYFNLGRLYEDVRVRRMSEAVDAYVSALGLCEKHESGNRKCKELAAKAQKRLTAISGNESQKHTPDTAAVKPPINAEGNASAITVSAKPARAKKTKNKSIFISSTFRDMHCERDALRDVVLPMVNEFAAKYGRAVELIDLRWGIDTASISEEEKNHKILRTCLDEIERSRPFFLGLIGDRYGTTPPRTYMKAALEAAQFSLEDMSVSVTALEIEYGVLRSEEPPVSLFYFRESPDYSAMPDHLRSVYLDGAEGLIKAGRLKEEIQARFGADVRSYKAEVTEKGLTVSKDWADMVAGDIIEKLKLEWGEPSETPPHWIEHERDIQEAFCESRTEYFAGRTDAIAELAAFCLGGDTYGGAGVQISGNAVGGSGTRILMLQGEVGSGKSGLLCKVMDEIENDCLLLPFCCGLSSRSSHVESMLKYFISLLCGKLGIEDESAEPEKSIEGLEGGFGGGIGKTEKFQDIKDRFFELLYIACKKTRVVAVVDALDQLAGGDESRRMLWISGRLPENFRLLCSIIDGPETDAVTRLGGEIRPMPPISREDEAAIIHDIAERHRKQISSAVVEHILAKKTPDGSMAAQNPLYLSLITHDLVMMDRYELDIVEQYRRKGMSQPDALAKFMTERIDETPGDPEGAYLTMLGRIEKLIGRDFVRGVCGMIAVSRSGLRESDMEAAFRELGMNYISADFSRLRQTLRGHFSLGDMQQWDFSHQSLRRALQRDRVEELKRLNDGVVAHFHGVASQDDFAVREIMHHLCTANRPDLAAEVLDTSHDADGVVLARGLADVYTEHAEGAAFLLAIPVNAEYVEASERWRIMLNITFCLPSLPENTHQYRIELMLAAIDMLGGQEDDETQSVRAHGECLVADLCTETGEIKKAGEYYQKSLEARLEIYKQSGTVALWNLSVSYKKMGNHLTSQGETAKAGEYYQKSLEATETLYKQRGTTMALRGLTASYVNMGNHLTSLGESTKAVEYYQKSLEARMQIYKQSGTAEDLKSLSVSYINMGNHLTSQGESAKAGEYYRKSLEARLKIYEQSGTTAALRDLSVSYNNMGDHLTSQGESAKAGEYYQKSLEARMQIYKQSGTVAALRDLSISHERMGDHLRSQGESAKAGEYYQKLHEARMQIYKQSGTAAALRDLSISYDRMGKYLTSQGESAKAGEYYQKSLEALLQIYEQSGTVAALRDLSISHERMGDHLRSQGESAEAGEYYQKWLEARLEIYEQSDTVAALRDLIISYDKVGDNKFTQGLYEQAHSHSLKAWELFQECAKRDASLQKHEPHFLKKTKRSEKVKPPTAEITIKKAEQITAQRQAETDLKAKESELMDKQTELFNKYNRLGEINEKLDSFNEAEEAYKAALEIRKEQAARNPEAFEPLLAESYQKLGDFYVTAKRMPEANEAYSNAKRLLERHKSRLEGKLGDVGRREAPPAKQIMVPSATAPPAEPTKTVGKHSDKAFTMPAIIDNGQVSSVFGRVYVYGALGSGSLTIGDKVKILSYSGKESAHIRDAEVAAIVNGIKKVTTAHVGDEIGVLLKGVKKGELPKVVTLVRIV